MYYMGIHCVVNVHVLYGYTLCGECTCFICVGHCVVNVHVLYVYTLCGECAFIIWVYIMW